MKTSIIGCGFIGSELAKFIDKNNGFKLIGLNDTDKRKSDFLLKSLKNNSPKFMDIGELIKKSGLIIESAGKDAVGSILKNENLDNKNKKLLIMSTGGLTENLELLNKIKNCEVLLPSGAIAGLDAIKSVSGHIKSLTLTTTKPAKGLQDAPYVFKNKLNLRNLRAKKIIFEGRLKDAVNGFPQNINVAATLFLASKFSHIKVKIIADQNTEFNTHEITAKGEFGEVHSTTKNIPSKNPRTSYLAVLSAIEILNNLKANVRIGN